MIVLIHGLHGAAGDLAYMAGVLRQRCVDDDDGVRVLLPTCNEGRTHDGIEAGAARLLQWLLPELASARYLSVIGHSLGGLYARCLIGMLADRHVIPDRVTPVAYVTFATPHLGSRQHRHLLGTWAPSWASASLFGTTGRQLMLDDDDAGPPLLVRLARPPFITGLALFQKRVAYGNVHGDGIVHYATSTVRRYNPFDGAAPAAPWVVVEDKHDNGDRRPRNAHVNEMVGNLERLDWQRLAVRPGRSLFAHVDIVVVLEAFSAPYGRPIVGDVAERVIGALHDQLLLHPAPSSSLLVRMVDDVLFGSDDADRPAR